MILSKREDDETSILSGIIKSVPDELVSSRSTDDEKGDDETRRSLLPKAFRFLRKWHHHFREITIGHAGGCGGGLVTDHVMHRVISGIFVPGPDDNALSPSQLLQHFYNELGKVWLSRVITGFIFVRTVFVQHGKCSPFLKLIPTL